MNKEQRAFATHLTAESKTHERWLQIMRFGLNTLLESPDFLIELICQEAERRTSDDRFFTETLAEYINELGLTIVINSDLQEQS